MSMSRGACLFLLGIGISPLGSAAQSEFAASARAPRNDSIVSVEELRMPSKVRSAFDKGAALLKKGEVAASVPYFERVIAESPGYYKAYYNLGLAQLRSGHTAEAQAAFQKAIDLTGGGYAPPQFGMGMVLCQLQDLQAAEVVLQRGLDLDPGSANGKYFLGWAQFGLNRLVEAERSVQQALVRKANFAEAYLLLARIHQRQQNAPGVIVDLEAYLKLEPHGASSDYARSILEKTQRDLQESSRSATTADAH